jgi:hypothetical protein
VVAVGSEDPDGLDTVGCRATVMKKWTEKYGC